MLDILQQHVSEFSGAVGGKEPDRDENFLRKIKTSSKIPPQLALEIYRNNTRGARINALELIYPACSNILGRPIFRSIAREFVIQDTAGCADLNTYGKTFNQHLGLLLAADRIPVDYIYLPDLARLEYSYHSAYYADNDPAFDFDDFEKRVASDAEIYFQLSHSLRLVASAYPLHQIWMQNCYPHESQQVQAIQEMQYLVVYRDKYKPAVAPVRQCEYRMLEAFTNRWSLQQLIDRSDCDLARILPKMIAQKWIAGISNNG